MPDRKSPERGQAPRKRRRLVLWLLFGGLAAIGLGVAVTLNWPTAPSARANSDDPAQVSLGTTVYTENCASCHGANLEGQPDWRIRKSDGRLPAPPHDETGHTWHHPDEQLFEITKSGVAVIVPGYESDMPAFESVLSDEEIWAVLSYIGSTWSPEIKRRRDLRMQRMKQ
jgi:mono/diheme cytochrome c family protein